MEGLINRVEINKVGLINRVARGESRAYVFSPCNEKVGAFVVQSTRADNKRLRQEK